ncbi:MAG: ATP-binding protein [Bacteroidota bacterium]|nr:ATP-binding protein [Bacteroidota bacterium]
MGEQTVKKSDLERMQEELAEMARFPEMNPGPVCRFDKTGKILLANSKAKKLFGEFKLIGQSWFEICPGIHADIWQDVLNCKTTFTLEAEIGKLCILFTYVCSEDHVFVYGTDITVNKLNERKLEEQKATIAEIARFPDMNPGPVLRMNLESLVLLSNNAATAVFGENLLGRYWNEILPNINKEVWKNILNSSHIVPVEKQIGEIYFVFNHRRDFKTNLIFVFGTDITIQKLAEKQLRQSEKMATLGTLAAGVAHELNNPAAAAARAAKQLKVVYHDLEKRTLILNGMGLTQNEREMIQDLSKLAMNAVTAQGDLNSMERSDRELILEEWLEEREIENSWSLAPSMAAMNLDIPLLNKIESNVHSTVLKEILAWLANTFIVYSLLHEISEGAGRISEIVGALKNYSFLGQAPIQKVNIHEGIDNTLVILRSKIKSGVVVLREYAETLPHITAYGSELNQVWTNIIDNSIDAMKGKGEIIIRTTQESRFIVVEIEDNGPGISEEIQSRIFDPFFTTKEPGKGTGLGLATSYGIITEKHKGLINLQSMPGMTKFIVKLPIDSSQ